MVDSGTVKLSANKTKWTSLEVRTHPTFLETLISKYDFGPVKLPGLLRNRPLVPKVTVSSVFPRTLLFTETQKTSVPALNYPPQELIRPSEQ